MLRRVRNCLCNVVIIIRGEDGEGARGEEGGRERTVKSVKPRARKVEMKARSVLY